MPDMTTATLAQQENHNEAANECLPIETDRWTGKDWVDFLSEFPQFANQCKWERLNKEDWIHLLPFEFIEGLDGRDLIGIVDAGGHLEYLYPWDYLERNELVEILSRSRRPEVLPELIHKGDWQRLDGGDYAKVFSKHPLLRGVERCGKKLTLDNWVELLSVQPQIAGLSKCPWKQLQRSLSGRRWAKLLAKQPQFSVHCPWNKLDRFDWAWLLLRQPRFVALVPWEKVQHQDRTKSKEPGDVAFPFDWFRPVPSSENTSAAYIDKVPLDRLNHLSWVALLTAYPRFASHCPPDKLNGTDWSKILAIHPQVWDCCPWDKISLTGWDWARLLSWQPQFADRCPWDKVSLTGSAWAELLSRQPQFADRCPWAKISLTGWDWFRLLSWQPQFADRCPWDKISLTGSAYAELLSRQPQFADRCPWDKISLTGFDWAVLLASQPQFADRCPWDKLDKDAWNVLLRQQPQFADRCPWNTFNWVDRSCLWEQPQIVKYCSWKLIGSEWASLLAEHPELASYCRWDKLDWTDWQWLLAAQPQFSDRVPWESLPGYDWLHLLSVYPQSVPLGLFKRLFKRMFVHDFKDSVTRIRHCLDHKNFYEPDRWENVFGPLGLYACSFWLGALGLGVMALLHFPLNWKPVEPVDLLVLLLVCPILGIPVFFLLATIRTILVLPLHTIKLIRAKRNYEKVKKTQELIRQTGFEASDS